MEEEYIPSKEILLKTIEYYKEKLEGAITLKEYYKNQVRYLKDANAALQAQIQEGE
jgi:hypothetical protein